MSNDNMLLPQSGYVFPPQFSPYQSVPGITQLPIIQPQSNFPVIPSTNPSTDVFTRYNRLPSSASLSSELSVPPEMEAKIITWEDLQNLLPDVLPEGRVECGLLSDGRAFAPKTARKDHYFLFPSKLAYITYFIHYYFSRDNLDRDQTIRQMMSENSAVPIDKIIEAPRLASIGTTVDDMKKAVETNGSILCLQNTTDSRWFVKRIDGYPGNASSPALGSFGGRTRVSFDGSINSVTHSEQAPVSPSTSIAEPPVRDDIQPLPSIPIPLVSTVSPSFTHLPEGNIYPQHQQPPFIRPPSRPVANAASINSVAAAMAAMNFGQAPPPGPHHLFSHLQSQNSLAATLALLSQRGSTGLAFANPLAHYGISQGRGGPSVAPQQQQLYHHRRSTPPPPPPATWLYQFVPPPPPQFYPFQPHHQPHEAPTASQLTNVFLPQHYDQWSTDPASAAIAATGFQLQYVAAAAAVQQPLSLQSHPHATGQSAANIMVWPQVPTQIRPQQASTQTPSPLHPSQSHTPVTTMVQSDSNSVGVHPCAKDDPSIVAVTDVTGKTNNDNGSGFMPKVVNNKEPVQQAAPPAPLMSRPHSSGTGKGGKFKTPKGGGGGGSHPRCATAPALANRPQQTASVPASKDQQPPNAAAPVADE